MAKKRRILNNREATENLGYLIKLIIGAVVIIGSLLYMVFALKVNYEQIKEIMIYVIIYLMGYGTRKVIKKNDE